MKTFAYYRNITFGTLAELFTPLNYSKIRFRLPFVSFLNEFKTLVEAFGCSLTFIKQQMGLLPHMMEMDNNE